MEKISKNFSVDGNCIYRKGKTNYMDKPKGTYIKYYLYDDKEDLYIGILKRPTIILPMLLSLLFIFNMGYLISGDVGQHKVEIATTIFLENNKLGLNIVNDAKNFNDVEVSIKSSEGGTILDKLVIHHGESIGNLDVDTNIEPGSYMCTLNYKVKGRFVNTEKNYEILLIVK